MRPDLQMTTPPVRVASGEAEVERGIDKANLAPQGATIAQRRADSIRLQAIGQIGGGVMAHYRKVDVRIWNDAKFNSLSHLGKLAFLLLITHPNMTMLGAMRATPEGLSAELKSTPEAFREAFGEVLSKERSRGV